MTRHVEGITSPQVPDSTKFVCPRCNSSLFYISSTLDDPIDITKDAAFAALMIHSDNPIMGLVALCHNCGNEWVPLWYTFDEVATDGTDMTMTAFDTDRDPGAGANAVADLCAGLFMVCLVDAGTDKGKYVTIATNTAADPAVITPQAHNANGDGWWMITNILPVGLTAV